MNKIIGHSQGRTQDFRSGGGGTGGYEITRNVSLPLKRHFNTTLHLSTSNFKHILKLILSNILIQRYNIIFQIPKSN